MRRGNQICIRPLEEKDAEASLKFQTNNREFFEQFSMTRPEDFYSLKGQAELIQRQKDNRKNDEGYSFGIFRNEDETLIGSINLFQVFRGDLQSAFIGYFLDKSHNGKGFTTEAVKLIVDYAFSEIKLHRRASCHIILRPFLFLKKQDSIRKELQKRMSESTEYGRIIRFWRLSTRTIKRL